MIIHLLLVLNVFIVASVDLSDLEEFGTPESFLEKKCNAYPTQTLFRRNSCYIRGTTGSDVSNQIVVCNHLRGFKAEIPEYNQNLIDLLEYEAVLDSSIPTAFRDKTHGSMKLGKGGVICKYTDYYYCEGKEWLKHNTHCFKVFKNLLTHSEAQKFCRKKGATLAVPHKDEALQFLARIVYMKNVTTQNLNHFFWIGMYVENHKVLKTSDGTFANHFRWLPFGHQRTLVAGFNTPNPSIALAASPANSGKHSGVFGYNQVINGNFHKLAFVCQKIAKKFGKDLYIPHSILNKK